MKQQIYYQVFRFTFWYNVVPRFRIVLKKAFLWTEITGYTRNAEDIYELTRNRT